MVRNISKRYTVNTVGKRFGRCKGAGQAKIVWRDNFEENGSHFDCRRPGGPIDILDQGEVPTWREKNRNRGELFNERTA